jgi:hypothetical protein
MWPTLIARVFPAHKAFVRSVMEMFDQAPGSYTFGPYATDRLTYRSTTVVEYRTLAQTDGLGTHFRLLEKNGSPIDGVAVLIGKTPDLLLLSARLPVNLSWLTSSIVRQFEHDAARLLRD